MNSLKSPQPKRTRLIVAGALVIFLGGILALSLSLHSPPQTHGLTTTTSSGATPIFPNKKLPPSRDNDAGRARAIDSTPDNDTDAWQRG